MPLLSVQQKEMLTGASCTFHKDAEMRTIGYTQIRGEQIKCIHQDSTGQNLAKLEPDNAQCRT